ncbi:protein obstructor-E-like [Plodia interpunctella]|uniref:protein obstructor-E-like n=1 Tax=Plodia interpunctella TaxID=58824 RepID=UPI002367C5BE|nr:protein obstructor-E-like [Plodia interpunctella]
MKVFVVLAYICAVGYGQFGNTQYQSSFGQNYRGQNTFQQAARPQSQNTFVNQNQRSQYQQNQYQQAQPQFQQPSAPRSQNLGSCKDNERSPISGSCDRYIECVNGTSEERSCPDGLLFNPNASGYPCQYPNEVACLERSSLQPAQPTDDCPHQFGFYKLGDARNCSYFRNCVNGVGYDFSCPEGLAFSPETYRCEWPDQVADCDAEAFLGFRCPEVPVSRELGPPAGFRYYRADNNCQKYFLCIDGRPRVLSCGGDSAFDDLTSTCVSADEVAACPAELRDAAARSRAEEKQRLAKEIDFYSKPQQHKRRF